GLRRFFRRPRRERAKKLRRCCGLASLSAIRRRCKTGRALRAYIFTGRTLPRTKWAVIRKMDGAIRTWANIAVRLRQALSKSRRVRPSFRARRNSFARPRSAEFLGLAGIPTQAGARW